MASGFVQRFKGKTSHKLLTLGSGGITLSSVTDTPNIAPADLASLKDAGTAAAITSTATTLKNGGVSAIGGTTASKTFSLADPYPGRRATVTALAASSAARIVKPATTGVTFDGTNATITFSTAGGQAVSLQGISTAAYAILGLSPPSTVSGPAVSA